MAAPALTVPYTSFISPNRERDHFASRLLEITYECNFMQIALLRFLEAETPHPWRDCIVRNSIPPENGGVPYRGQCGFYETLGAINSSPRCTLPPSKGYPPDFHLSTSLRNAPEKLILGLYLG